MALSECEETPVGLTADCSLGACTGDYTVSPSLCSGQTQPATSKPCNTQSCGPSHHYAVSAWSTCTKACGGVRTRTVACQTLGGVAAEAAMCAALPVPATSELCNDCTFCDTTLCSGHGTCSSITQTCACATGYSGLTCHQSTSCAGPVGSNGACCGAGSVLDKADACCAPAVPGTRARLDRAGACCPSGVLNACGVCDGPATAVMALGVCCTSGVREASGKCCASGNLDAFGVCDGNDASGKQEVDLQFLGLPTGYTQSALDNTQSSERVALDADLESFTAHSLGRATDKVNVVGYAVGARRQLAADSRRRLPGSTVTASIDLLPYGGSNNVPESLLASMLSAGATPPTIVSGFSQVQGSTLASMCGNNVCEAGERPDAGNGVSGCTLDCPYPVYSCPAAHGAECNGAGFCAPVASSATGVCVCNTDQGYLGADCSVCAPGFIAGPVAGECVHVESSAALAANRNAHTLGKSTPPTAWSLASRWRAARVWWWAWLPSLWW